MNTKVLLFVLLQICCINFALALQNNSPTLKNLTTTKENIFDYKNQPESFWRKHLSKEEFNICRARNTEKAFSGKYDKFFKKGTYYCACCGGTHPVFSSTAKFDSKTGWPSFWAPINKDSVAYREDTRIINILFGAHNEILCARCSSHLGHLFNDGPKEHNNNRFCINSTALVFVAEGESPKSTFSIDPQNN